MERVPPFNPQQLTAIAKILGDTGSGLSGSQIEYLLQDSRIPDVSHDMTKWKRLFNAFVEHQNEKQYGNHIVMFINRAMNPVQYTDTPTVFDSRREQLNAALAFCGMTIGDDGKVRRAAHAENLPEAFARASRLHAALKGRHVHDDVLTFCKAELLESNYFHAVFEAVKSIASKIRSMSGLTCDGADLVRGAFGLNGGPLLAINALAPIQTWANNADSRFFGYGPTGSESCRTGR